MEQQPQKITVEWGVFVEDGTSKKIIPCDSKPEALALVAKYSHDTPLFGEPVTAKLIKRAKTVTITYSKWKII